MRILSQPAIVLHARRWRETSLLLELFTRDHGRVGVVVRGIHGARRQPLRAALQPLHAISVDYLQRGELATLLQAEAIGSPPKLAGDALMAALYVAELSARLLPRDDAAPELFHRFAEVLGELAATTSLAWTLRRFERDLLQALGYGLPLDVDVDGQPLDPAARYQVDPEYGFRRDRSVQAGRISGAALLALAQDVQPAEEFLREQRGALRAVIAFHLGSRGLRSWGMLAEVARLAPVRTDGGDTVIAGTLAKSGSNQSDPASDSKNATAGFLED